ncbi:TetR/AcrR family transcriptional regulator [Dongshaea marina]|uniref:TetR/AcrR family transcriptional regulator n=1 Tax=Dongshaea marina TaxID=2047966 RepID=UPI000D3E3108|nr:TetR/AcrR family transcriptional regulator [Dongshaea marina]
MKTKYQDTQQHLLDTGQAIFAAKGFSGVGLSHILQQAGVPKGSFYHYFKSKEHFGQSVLEHYFSHYLKRLALLLDEPGVTSRSRLINYLERWRHNYSSSEGVQDCLVVKLSAEVADLSEAMRLALRDGTARIIQRIAVCLEAGIADGSITSDEPQQTACIIYQQWLGASLLTKLHRDATHVDLAMQMTQQLLSAT